MELLIKEARIVDSSQDFIGDVYIKDGMIKEIGIDINKDCKVLQGRGYTLLPSFIDMHAHFREPGLTYKEDILSGCLAAVKGGYTAVNLMPNTKPVCSNMEVINTVLTKSKKLDLVDIHQCMSITKDLDGETLEHLDCLDDDKAGLGVRIISDDGKGVSKSKVMLDAMVKAKSLGIIVMSHAEHEEIKDTRLTENIITARDIALARHTGCHLHLAHVSTIEAMKDIIRAKEDGVNVTCEVTPHHIALSNDMCNYRVNPPIREKEDMKFLIKCIKEGWVDCIGTDHAPHSKEDKENGAPGMSGIEIAFSICYTTLVDENFKINSLTEIMSKKPAKILGLNKGEIKIGYDGDVVLVDLDKTMKINSDTFVSKGKNTPFDSMEFKGEVIATVKSGRVVYAKEDFLNDN